MKSELSFQAQIDGRAAKAEELSALACAGFAHFTAMQVRKGAVRGLDLHLARLRSASLELFYQAPADDWVRQQLRAGIAQGPPDLSLTATMFSRRGEFTRSGVQGDPAILVRTRPPYDGPKGPLRLAAVAHERWLPTIKHVGEAAKTYYLRKAVKAGYDDAAFIDARGNLSEATIWNLAFWDGERVIWPKTARLDGITMGIVRRQLDTLNVPQSEEAISLDRLKSLKGAAVMNSWTPGVSVIAIGAVPIPSSPRFLEILRQAYESEPLEPI